jgi:predicted  nucleic acid-binding Zn-ribbon protein
MGLHPYVFKWRLRSFNGLLVMILRHMRNARELDSEIAQISSEIGRLEKRLEGLESKVKKVEGQKEIKSTQKQITKQVGKIKEKIDSFCEDVKKELEYFKKTDINDYTLLYRGGARYLIDLAKILIASKSMNKKTKNHLKKQLKEEMKSVERKAESLELQAKHLERGVANTVALSQISPWGNKWLEFRVRRKTIEVNQIHDILKSSKGMNLPGYFDKMILDIYQIGRDTNMLMKRLKGTFNSLRTKLKKSGVRYRKLDKTQSYFMAVFNRMERLGKRLDNEIESQAHKLNDDLGVFEKKTIKLHPLIKETRKKAA